MSEKYHAINAQPAPMNDEAESNTSNTSEARSALSNHKGKLAIGAAATLGIMVFYNWREKKLAKEDPENYARLQRLKTLVRTDGINVKKQKNKERALSEKLKNKSAQKRSTATGPVDGESKIEI